MTGLVMLEAALFQLRAAVASLEDEFYTTQIRLAVNVLAGAVNDAGDKPNAANVNEIEFALNDLVGLAGELSAADSLMLEPSLALVREDLQRLKEETSLAPSVVQHIALLVTKLKARRAAIERETFRDPSVEAQPLPHPPEELSADAQPLRARLAGAGFSTPALDALIASPGSLRFHSISEIIDELEVITR